MRVGVGFDVHPLVEGRPLVLGGVDVPHERGLAGHSDGDVLTHALIDALLGAASLGDMGSHFPTDDPRYEGAQSLSLLSEVKGLLWKGGWRVANVDATIVAEHPRLASYIADMRRAVAETLEVELGMVSIKATTSDGLGFTGRGEGIAVHAVASVEALS